MECLEVNGVPAVLPFDIPEQGRIRQEFPEVRALGLAGASRGLALGGQDGGNDYVGRILNDDTEPEKRRDWLGRCVPHGTPLHHPGENSVGEIAGELESA